MARLSEKEAKETWIKLACAALAGYTPQEEFDDPDELADDMAAVASRCADAMLDSYEGLFETTKRRKSRRGDDEDPEIEERE